MYLACPSSIGRRRIPRSLLMYGGCNRRTLELLFIRHAALAEINFNAAPGPLVDGKPSGPVENFDDDCWHKANRRLSTERQGRYASE